jgi:hypothetical protein
MKQRGREESQVLTDITRDAKNNRQLEAWFHTFYDELYYHTVEHFSVLDVDSTFYRLAAALPKCKAQTAAQFRKWAKQQIKKQANRVRIFEHADRLAVEDILTLAETQQQRKSVKPFECEQHGEKAFIRLEDKGTVLPWIVPVYWLPVAKALWPVHVRHNRSGAYVSKKVARQRLNGLWEQRDLPVHRLFLNCESGHIVEAADGNFLNWTEGNLRVHGIAPDVIPDDRTVSLESLSQTLTLNWLPARPKRIVNRERSGTNDHDRRVLAWLRGAES